MSDYIEKLAQMKKDIGLIQDSLFFEMHNLEKELAELKSQLAKVTAELDRLAPSDEDIYEEAMSRAHGIDPVAFDAGARWARERQKQRGYYGI